MFEKFQLEYHKQFLLCKLLISILIFRDCCSILEVFVAILLDWGEKGEKSGSNHIVGRHDTQHNDIHHCDIQHNIKIVNLKFNMYFCYAELRLCRVSFMLNVFFYQTTLLGATTLSKMTFIIATFSTTLKTLNISTFAVDTLYLLC